MFCYGGAKMQMQTSDSFFIELSVYCKHLQQIYSKYMYTT